MRVALKTEEFPNSRYGDPPLLEKYGTVVQQKSNDVLVVKMDNGQLYSAASVLWRKVDENNQTES